VGAKSTSTIRGVRLSVTVVPGFRLLRLSDPHEFGFCSSLFGKKTASYLTRAMASANRLFISERCVVGSLL
jgi:hypothetical protein